MSHIRLNTKDGRTENRTLQEHRDEHVVFVYECQVNRLARHVRDDITTLVGLRRDGRISVRLPRHRHLPLVERRTAENNVRVYLFCLFINLN